MGTVTLQANSTTLILNGTPYNDFGAGDILTISFPNPKSGRVNGSRDSVNANKRSDAGVAVLRARFQKYSQSDIALNSARNAENLVVFNGTVKEDFNSDGVDGVCTYILEGGTITEQPEDTRNDQDGNALMEYTIEFRNAQRNL